MELRHRSKLYPSCEGSSERLQFRSILSFTRGPFRVAGHGIPSFQLPARVSQMCQPPRTNCRLRPQAYVQLTSHGFSGNVTFISHILNHTQIVAVLLRATVSR